MSAWYNEQSGVRASAWVAGLMLILGVVSLSKTAVKLGQCCRVSFGAQADQKSSLYLADAFIPDHQNKQKKIQPFKGLNCF